MNEELKIIIRAELEQFKKAMREAVSGLKGVANESRKASKEVDGFTAEVNQQGKALSDLKKKYVDLAAAHGKESKEAKDAAEAIRKLSAEYKTNKQLATNLANDANKFDLSLGTDETSEGVKETATSIEDLKGSLQSLYALNVWEFIGKSFDNWKQKSKEAMKTMKEEFNLAGIYLKQAWGELKLDPETLINLDAVGESRGQAAKGALESLGLAASSAGAAISAAFAAVAAAIVAAVAVIVSELAIIIALAKNAFTVAKEVKAMSAEASKIGMKTDTYQEWGYVLKQVGIEADKLTDFIKTLTEEQNAVREGSEDVAKAFEKIGLSQEEVLGSSQEELFRKSVEGLQNIENEAERTSLAYKIFGEDAADLANILYLNNQETQRLVDNYYALGGAPSDNLINKSKILGGSTTNLSYAWQGLRNTLAEWVIPAVIKVVQWITIAIAYVNIFLQGIFGIKGQTKEAAKGVENVSSGVGGVGTNAKKATAAVKELLRYTMGFDELNIIPKQSTGGGSDDLASGIGGGFSSANINPELPVIDLPDMSKFKEFMSEYGSLIQGIAAISLVGIGIFMAVFGFLTANPIMGFLGLGLAGLGIGIGAAGGENSTWNKLIEGIKKVWSNLTNWFNSKVKPVFTKDYWAEKWNTINTAANEKLTELKTKINEKVEPIKQWFNDKVKPIFSKDFWITMFSSILVGAALSLINLKLKIDEKMKPIRDWFENKVKPIFTKDYWKQKFDTVKQGAGEKLGELKAKIDEKLAPIKSWFENKLKPIFTKDYWADKFSTIKSGAKDALNGLISIVESAINQIIRKINTLSWKVPDWVPSIGGKKWGFNFSTIYIPRLAEGGIATSSVLANIGERGKEAVLPLENNTEWMDMLADRINGRNTTPSRIVLMVDGKELGYAAINSINGITRQTGELQLQLI